MRVHRYRATFDMAGLLEAAQRELARDYPERYKFFLLAAMAGRRRNEIDKLPWSAFRWKEEIIRIEATQFFRPNSHDSDGDVLVDPKLLEIFRGFPASATSEFVIESSVSPDSDTLGRHYRCQTHIGINCMAPLERRHFQEAVAHAA